MCFVMGPLHFCVCDMYLQTLQCHLLSLQVKAELKDLQVVINGVQVSQFDMGLVFGDSADGQQSVADLLMGDFAYHVFLV